MVQKIVNAGTMLGGNWKDGDAKGMKRRGMSFLRWGIHFVHCKDERLPRGTQEARKFFVQWSQASLAVYDKNKQPRFFDGHLRLPKNFLRNQCLFVRNDPARIDYFQSFA